MGTRETRQAKLIEMIQSQSGVSIHQMAEYFGVSAVTIRSDLEQLEKAGAIIRTVGGAVSAQDGDPLHSIRARSRQQKAEKRLIGQIAAGLVDSGESVMLDPGTTTIEIVPHLRGLNSLTIITQALNIAIEASALPHATVIVPCAGALDPASLTLNGDGLEEAIGQLHVDKYFMGVGAVHQEHGLMDTSAGLVRLKQVMMRAAREVIVVVDSAKIGKVSLFKVAPVQAVHAIVTDEGADPAILDALLGLGLKVHVARMADGHDGQRGAQRQAPSSQAVRALGRLAKAAEPGWDRYPSSAP